MDSNAFSDFLSKCKEFSHDSPAFQRMLKDRNHAGMTKNFIEHIIRFKLLHPLTIVDLPSHQIMESLQGSAS